MNNPLAEPATLIASLDEKARGIRTRALDLSFNELADMEKAKELIIRPAYQRLFRWSEGKQSRFIESLLLEMPIPPLYVIEIEEGRYELIDGLQRLSSYLHFRGTLDSRRDKDGNFLKLVLEECDVVPGLNGLKFDDLPTAFQVKLKRRFVRVEVVGRDSNAALRYHMFKRLNTGGELLSEQEVRNCTIRLLDEKFNTFLEKLVTDVNFLATTEPVPDAQREQLALHEHVLRFFAFKNARERYRHAIGDFLTEFMEAVSRPDGTPFDYDAEEKVFRKTFEVLNSALGVEVFCSVQTDGRVTGGFGVYLYEAFTLGLQKHLDRFDPQNELQMRRLGEQIKTLKTDSAFRKNTVGGGLNDPNPLKRRIGMAEAKLTGQ